MSQSPPALAALSFCVAGLWQEKEVANGKRLLSWLILVPWALPGTVVAVSLAEAYGRPSRYWVFYPRRHVLDLPVVYFLRFMRWWCAPVQASMEQIDAALEEAASSRARAGGND